MTAETTDLWRRIDARILGLIAIALLSLIFQLILHGYAGDDRAATPDTPAYFDVAVQIEDALQGTGKLEGHVLRTPGYPLFLLAAGKSAGIELSDVELPIRNWAATNAEGKALVQRVVLLQEIMGFAIPPLIYLVMLGLGAPVIIAGLASLAYFLDIRSVAFQYVLLNETLSLLLMLAVVLVFIRAVKSRGTGAIVSCGILTGLMLWVRPPLAVLVVILCATALLMFYLQSVSIKSMFAWFLKYVVVVAIFPLGWSYVNYQGTGHFFYTMNAAITLQNFGGRYFVEMDVDDPELKVLQHHAALELVRVAERGDDLFESYPFWRTTDDVMADLGIDDEVYPYILAGRANRMAIMANPMPFLYGSAERWYRSWFHRLGNIKNNYALERLREFGLPGKALAYNGHMLFGPVTFFAFVILVPLAALKMPLQARIWFISFAAFALLYSVAVTMADENEPIRHAMQIRIVVNGMLITACCMLLYPWAHRAGWIRRLAELK